MPPCGVWKTTRVPAAEVNDVVAEYQLDNPTSVDKVDNQDGTFDVTATFAPCPDGSAQGQS